MKKVNLKNFLMMLSVTLAFLFVGMGQAGAQTQSPTINASNNTSGGISNNPKSLMTPPTGNFVTQAEAISIVEVYASYLKVQLEITQPGTPTADAIEREYLYFSGIYNALLKGFSVPEAIVEGLKEFTDAVAPVSNTAKMLLKQSAIAKLAA